jgi:hypothetical protein
MAVANCPLSRNEHTTVWTGSELIVWGGKHGSQAGYFLNTGGIYSPGFNPPAITGPDHNTCPGTTVGLSAGIYPSYQWRRNGQVIPGATGQIYDANLSGEYTVSTTPPDGCEGTSLPFTVTISFCSTTEVSPQGSPVPLRIMAAPASSTGFYLYFEKIPPASGYNIYEGSIGDWYSHGDAPGSDCGTVVSDLGTGEMRAELAPDTGGRYYLVTAFGGGYEGPSGFDSAGLEIPSAQSTCAP